MTRALLFATLLVFLSACAVLPQTGIPLPSGCQDNAECIAMLDHPEARCINTYCECPVNAPADQPCDCPAPRCELPPEPGMCTMDAKLCPDGSGVGRIPPWCDFAPCPTTDKLSCETDNDCVCGGIDPITTDCFVGNKNYYDNFVNKEQDCPDFCTGIDGRLHTLCLDNTCQLIRGEPPVPQPRVEVVAIPAQGTVPLNVKLEATVRNIAHPDQFFHCAETGVTQDWEFGDGHATAPLGACIPDSGIPLKFHTEHRYEQPGRYDITFRLGNLTSNPATVIVLRERLPPECDEDADCVPAQCCHAADCIIKEKRADCSKVACTMDCRPGTLDCGGSCGCIGGRCTGRNFQPGAVTQDGQPWQALPAS